jgi:hypothetical protein
LAIRPHDAETFVKEVDEELRRERLNQMMTRYGTWIVVAIVLLLAAVGGAIWWKSHNEAQAAAQGESMLQALDSMEAGNRNAATAKIDSVADSDVEGYRVAALFARASTQADGGNAQAAVATLRSIADDQKLAEPYRQAALLRQTALEFDRLQPQVVVRRLSAMARPGQPWFGSAGELVGMAQLKMRRPDLAGPLFQRIGRDDSVPPTIRTRAIQMAGSLGYDAMPEPSAAPAEAQSGPATAGTREKAQ